MEKTSLEDWHKVIDLNLWGYVHTIQALLPQFLARGAGTIVNVGSFGGKVPLPYMTAYCTSKYAIAGLTETLRLELEPKGIQVCGVHPSVTKSAFLERSIFRGQDEQETNERQQRMAQMLESPLASQPEDVAKKFNKSRVGDGQTQAHPFHLRQFCPLYGSNKTGSTWTRRL
jgi:short-subunit dehydrogenase